MEPYIGQISMVAFNFAPRNFAKCDGQLLAISQNTALFSLLGTTYGGNGQTTFGLPDLRGRVPIHQGTGPGLSPYVLGERGGSESETLITSEMPMHNHFALASSQTSDQQSAIDHYWGAEAQGATAVYGQSANGTMNPNAVGQTGGNQPHTNLQPFLTINFVIALYGVFPPRN